MKKSLLSVFALIGLLLAACGGSEYDAEIEEVIELYKNDDSAMMWMDEEQINRENADISFTIKEKIQHKLLRLVYYVSTIFYTDKSNYNFMVE